MTLVDRLRGRQISAILRCSNDDHNEPTSQKVHCDDVVVGVVRGLIFFVGASFTINLYEIFVRSASTMLPLADSVVGQASTVHVLSQLRSLLESRSLG